jgi:Resolvase, N terminal domain
MTKRTCSRNEAVIRCTKSADEPLIVPRQNSGFSGSNPERRVNGRPLCRSVQRTREDWDGEPWTHTFLHALGDEAADWLQLLTDTGYACVSTGGQSVQRQVDELRKAGCAEILEETASGADRSRPVLAALLCRIRRGETLVCRREARSACPLPQAPAGCGPHPGGAGRGRLTPRRHAPY